jgi:predicted HTH domain antitoxin
MGLCIDIPDEIADAMSVPRPEREQRARIELAAALYAHEILSFGKARQLAGLTKVEFGRELDRRAIARHYTAENLAEDLAYARGQ